MSLSQNTQILKALQAGDRITPIDALERFGCFRLSGRIHDLKAMGYRIECKIVHGQNRKHWAEYYLVDKEPHTEGLGA